MTRFFLILACVSFYLTALAAEKAVKPAPAQETGVAFEEALQRVESQKNEELKALTARLSGQMERAIVFWISEESRKKESQLNQLVDQNWEKYSLTQPVSPLHYDYYLRGYSYEKTKSDITKTDSLVAPYKAVVIITDKLYVEKYHSPDISNRDPYFFTVTGKITLNLEYHKDSFVVTGSEYKLVSIQNDCPLYIKRLRL